MPKTRRLKLSAGHSVTIMENNRPIAKQPDRGVIVGTHVEGDLNNRVLSLVSLQLIYWGVPYTKDPKENVLSDSIAFFRKIIEPQDIAIEIHFNSGGGNGTEVIIPANPSKYERKWGEIMSATIAETLQIRDRGVKCEKTLGRRLGWMRIPCENFLPEICFLDNPENMKQYNIYKTSLPIRLAKLFRQMKED